MSRIYVASSWRNPHQPNIVDCLRLAGHEVYDFRNRRLGWKPTSKNGGTGRGKPSDKLHVRKVFAVWGELGRAGALTDRSRSALRKFVRRQTSGQCDDPEWLTAEQASLVTEGLKAMLRRHCERRAS